MLVHPYSQHNDKHYIGLYQFATAVVHGEDISELSTSRMLSLISELIAKLTDFNPKYKNNTVKYHTSLCYAGELPAVLLSISVDRIDANASLVFRIANRRIVIEESSVHVLSSIAPGSIWTMGVGEFSNLVDTLETIPEYTKNTFKIIAGQDHYKDHRVIFDYNATAGHFKLFNGSELVVEIRY